MARQSTDRKPRGRPRIGDRAIPSADVHFRLPADDYDKAFAIAARHRLSINDVIRRAIKRLIEDERGASLFI